ncbi:MAG TPA: class I SAM-dependent methyltransferase [Candidatus Limnocylindria bacterium]|nr:class I SAM-dependent methyltransferase [Candidatus Limnocylindria bacterium]
MDTCDQGHFAAKQLFSDLSILRWSHGSRFRVAVAKSAPFRGQRILDYGCGDATYFQMLLQSGHAPASMVGAELDPNVIRANETKFAKSRQVSFIPLAELDHPRQQEAYDAVVCMEVFEHLVDPAKYLDHMCALIKPGGRLLLSVPVEIGLPVVVKLSVRRLAAMRGIHGYDSTIPYTWGELFKSLFAGSQQHIPRVKHVSPDGSPPVHCHKGFNWKMLRELIAKRMNIEQVSGSPVQWLSPALGSQVWFEAVKPLGTSRRSGKSQTQSQSQAVVNA